MKRVIFVLFLALFIFFGCDSGTGLMWSAESSSRMNWKNAKTYCENLEEGGFSDWRLPTISELRTLIRNCSSTEAGGRCEVDDDCLVTECRTDKDCSGCAEDESGKYSLFGDTSWFWSSSPVAGNPGNAWHVSFNDGNVGNVDISDDNVVRCVRSSRGRVFPICRRLFAFWRRRYSP